MHKFVAGLDSSFANQLVAKYQFDYRGGGNKLSCCSVWFKTPEFAHYFILHPSGYNCAKTRIKKPPKGTCTMTMY